MSLSPSDVSLLRVSKSRKALLLEFKEGVHLEASTGRSIEDLREQACADRLHLAEQFLTTADRLTGARPPMRRVAVGRYYYAMYHAARAVVYFHTPGDDHEEHSNLPQHIPGDFPSSTYWQNELKDARLRRNEADYNPYPLDDVAFRTTAADLKTRAHKLTSEARSYLLAKGCAHL